MINSEIIFETSVELTQDWFYDVTVNSFVLGKDFVIEVENEKLNLAFAEGYPLEHSGGLFRIMMFSGSYTVEDDVFKWSIYEKAFDNVIDGEMLIWKLMTTFGILTVERVYSIEVDTKINEFDISKILEKYAIKVGNIWLTPTGDPVRDTDILRWAFLEERLRK